MVSRTAAEGSDEAIFTLSFKVRLCRDCGGPPLQWFALVVVDKGTAELEPALDLLSKRRA